MDTNVTINLQDDIIPQLREKLSNLEFNNLILSASNKKLQAKVEELNSKIKELDEKSAKENSK